MANRVDIRLDSPDFQNLKEPISQALEKALGFLNKDNCLVEVALVDDDTIKDINFKFRNKNKVTNVLSFENLEKFPSIEEEPEYLGEIILAPRFIKKTGDDFIFLVIHGLTHLMGYTHNNKNDSIEMEKLEKALYKHAKN